MAKIMVVIGFLVAFCAGLAVGLEARRTTVAAPPAHLRHATSGPTSRPGRASGWFVSQLNLTLDQQKQMNEIWSEVARGGRVETDKRRQQLRQERDQAILALIPAQEKHKYDQIVQNYQEQQQAMEREMRGRFERAVERTKALLKPEQRQKYEELLARQRSPERGGRGGPPGPEREHFQHRPGDGGATSKPSAQP